MLYVGCYTSASGGNGTGVTALRRDAGGLTRVGELAMRSPSWLTRHPSAPVLYATNESAAGTITTVALDGLTALGTVPTGGADPCHLAVAGEFLLCANYSSGSLAVFGLAADGRITGRTDLVTHEGSGPVAERQESAHVHMAVPLDTPQGTIVAAVDLGTDEIRSYLLSAAGRLEPLAVSAMPPGTGPRELVRRPGTDLAYVAGELAGTLVTVREGPPGTFTPLGAVPATASPYTAGPNHVAHIEIAGRPPVPVQPGPGLRDRVRPGRPHPDGDRRPPERRVPPALLDRRRHLPRRRPARRRDRLVPAVRRPGVAVRHGFAHLRDRRPVALSQAAEPTRHAGESTSHVAESTRGAGESTPCAAEPTRRRRTGRCCWARSATPSVGSTAWRRLDRVGSTA